jgi:hypothetical protein
VCVARAKVSFISVCLPVCLCPTTSPPPLPQRPHDTLTPANPTSWLPPVARTASSIGTAPLQPWSQRAFAAPPLLLSEQTSCPAATFMPWSLFTKAPVVQACTCDEWWKGGVRVVPVQGRARTPLSQNFLGTVPQCRCVNRAMHAPVSCGVATPRHPTCILHTLPRHVPHLVLRFVGIVTLSRQALGCS